MKLSKKLLTAIVLLLALALQSCDVYLDEPIDPNAASLTVYVYGALSQNPRANIAVSVHWTREEAESNTNPIAGKVYTNEYGEATFYNLPPDERFYIRAKPVLFKTIRETRYLYRGENYIDIPVP